MIVYFQKVGHKKDPYFGFLLENVTFVSDCAHNLAHQLVPHPARDFDRPCCGRANATGTLYHTPTPISIL